ARLPYGAVARQPSPVRPVGSTARHDCPVDGAESYRRQRFVRGTARRQRPGSSSAPGNSIVVTLGSTVLILAIGAMASHALAEYRFRLNRFLVVYFALGIMISIRLGSVGIVRLMSSLGLTITIWALLVVYMVVGFPFSIF